MRTAGRPGAPLSASTTSTTGYVAARVLLACGVMLGLSTAVAAGDGGRALVPLAGCAAASLVAGALLRRACTVPATLPVSAVHGAVLGGWVLLVVVGVATYAACGTFDGLDLALVEATAGFTTTAVSVLEPLDATPEGVLFWRASTQWLGGFAAVLVVVAVLPLLAAQPRSDRSAPPARRLPLRSPRLAASLRRLALAYLALSAAGVVLFLAGGLRPFDAVTYAMTTISTGGFGNHDGSIGYFDSALVEWVTIGGMALGGTSLVLVLAVARRRADRVWRSTELRAYGGALVLGGTAMAWWTAPAGGPTHESVRHALFAVVSAASTTGHTVGPWAEWSSGPQTLVLALAAVGAMSGATGGGFRGVRALTLLGVVRREVVRQLHPRSVAVVKVGRVTVHEAVISYTIGYQVAWLLLASVGALGLALAGVGVAAAMSGAVSAISTYGPALGELAPDAATDPPVAALVVLLPLMLAGRVEISPVAVGVAAAAARLGRTARRVVR